MEDKLLQQFFEKSRWQYAIDKGVGKDIDKAYLYQLCKPDVRANMYKAIKAAAIVRMANTPMELYRAFAAYNKARVPLHDDTRQSAAWVDAYKGAGAYFSMQNLIRFHGMYLLDKTNVMTGEDAIGVLDECADRKRGWELLGMLKEAIKLNHIDVAKKSDEWERD